MFLFHSLTGWVLIFSGIFGLIVGYYTHWIVGVIVFVFVVGKSALVAIIHDTVVDTVEYHHDRMDERAKNMILSRY